MPSAIERADIDGGFARHCASGDFVEFAPVIAREEDVVMGKIKAFSAGMRVPHHGRQGALARIKRGNCARAVLAKTARGNGIGIGVADHRISIDHIAIGKPHASCAAAAFGQDLSDCRSHPEGCALGFGHIANGLSQSVNAAIDQPHAGRLDMRD